MYYYAFDKSGECLYSADKPPAEEDGITVVESEAVYNIYKIRLSDGRIVEEADADGASGVSTRGTS